MSHETIRRQSPMFLPPLNKLPVTVTVGGLESDEFLRQSESYTDWCRQYGLTSDTWVRDGRHHFDVIADLADADSEIVNRLWEMSG